MTTSEAINGAKKKFVESSLFSGLSILLLSLLMAWGIWVTVALFTHSSILQTGRAERLMSSQIQWSKIEANSTELKTLRDMMFTNQAIIINRLNDIEVSLARFGALQKKNGVVK